MERFFMGYYVDIGGIRNSVAFFGGPGISLWQRNPQPRYDSGGTWGQPRAQYSRA